MLQSCSVWDFPTLWFQSLCKIQFTDLYKVSNPSTLSAVVVFTGHFSPTRSLILSKELLQTLPPHCWAQKNKFVCAVHFQEQRMEPRVRESRWFFSDLYHSGRNLIKIWIWHFCTVLCLVNYSALFRDGVTHFSSINSTAPFCVQTAVRTPSAKVLMSIAPQSGQ